MGYSPSPIYAFTCFATFILASSLGTLVFWKNRKSPAARWWTIMCFFVAAWAFWNAISLLSSSRDDAVKYLRIADAFALFVPATFLHFAMHFSGKALPRPLQLGYTATGLIFLTVGTPLFITAGQMKFGILFEVGGPSFIAFALLFVLLPGYGLRLLWQAARRSEGIRKAQLLCLLAACGLGFSGGFMWFLPALGIDIPPLGAHLVCLYCVIVAYAIVRYRFLDIHLIIRRSLVYSILITLLTVCYFGIIYAAERVSQLTFGYKSIWISLSAFALMALAFQPLKLGIQRVVDWLIFRVPQEELAKRIELLQEQALQAEKSKAVSAMAAGMAHEIKNPLTALKTFTEFIPERMEDREFLNKLHEVFKLETSRIEGIVREVLDFSKPKAPELRPVDLTTLIDSTVHLLSNGLRKRRVNWTVDCRHNGAVLQADPDQLRQILINLIQNAADAMPEGGALTITTKSENSHIELAISDTGQGIPKELLPKIFDPFFTTKTDGNGLGLAMVHSIIRAHRGTIRADSQLGQGTTFTVSLPI